MRILKMSAAVSGLMASVAWAALEESAPLMASSSIMTREMAAPWKLEGQSNSSASRRAATRLLLEFRFIELDRKLDSLFSDSLRMTSPMKIQYRDALLAAKAVRDKTRLRLQELRIAEEEANSKKWERIRARIESSMDGLRRFFVFAESARENREIRKLPEKEATPPSDI